MSESTSVSNWIAELIQNAPSHGFTTKEIATLVRSLATAKRSPGGCYECGSDAYGDFRNEAGRRTTLHRALFEALHGRLDDSLVVRHKCDNPPCIRPTHLESGSLSENTRDAYERARMAHINHAKGEDTASAVLTEQQVASIRRMKRAGASYRQIVRASFPHLSYTAVRSAAVGDTWAHYTDEPPCERDTRPGSTRLLVDRSEVEPQARERFEAGESLRSLSRELGVSTGTLTKWKREWEMAR